MNFGTQPDVKIQPLRVEQNGLAKTFFAVCRYFATEKWEFSSRLVMAYFCPNISTCSFFSKAPEIFARIARALHTVPRNCGCSPPPSALMKLTLPPPRRSYAPTLHPSTPISLAFYATKA